MTLLWHNGSRWIPGPGWLGEALGAICLAIVVAGLVVLVRKQWREGKGAP